jgi:hypothetical protein
MKEIEKKEATIIFYGIGAIFLWPLILYILWNNLIPSIFPGLVEQGFIASKITYFQAFFLRWMAQCIFSTIKMPFNNKKVDENRKTIYN